MRAIRVQLATTSRMRVRQGPARMSARRRACFCGCGCPLPKHLAERRDSRLTCGRVACALVDMLRVGVCTRSPMRTCFHHVVGAIMLFGAIMLLVPSSSTIKTPTRICSSVTKSGLAGVATCHSTSLSAVPLSYLWYLSYLRYLSYLWYLATSHKRCQVGPQGLLSLWRHPRVPILLRAGTAMDMPRGCFSCWRFFIVSLARAAAPG
jgi:hypothetical protein